VCAKPVLRKGENHLDWDNWGVRDIAILSDSDGNFIRDKSNLTSYFTGSKDSGLTQMVGRAFSSDNGITWKKNQENPVLSTSINCWDSKVASTPWVIKKGVLYFMYYRGSSGSCVKDAIGVATSTDGIKFEKYEGNPILTSQNFSSIRQNPCTMGVLNAVSDYNGNIIVLFEANESENEQRGQIFAAISEDGFNFNSLNEGRPIFSCRDVKSWPVRAVCNPRLIKAGNGIFMLAFNGSWNGEWSIGLAFTKDFRKWDEHMSNPVLVPRGYPVGSDYSHRVEGPCFDSSAIINGDNTLVSYLMAIPYGSLNHENGINARVEFKLTKPDCEQAPRFHAFPSDLNSVSQTKGQIQLNSKLEPSGYIQGSFINKTVKPFCFDFNNINFENKESAIFLCFSNTLSSIAGGRGIIIKISNRKIYILNNKQQLSINRFVSYVYRVVAKIISNPKISRPYCAVKCGNWNVLYSCKDSIKEIEKISYNCDKKLNSIKIIINGLLIEKKIDFHKSDYRVSTIAAHGASLVLNNIELKR
jgi:predicted GH43/DUF377 family glycosyl hydrolase